MLYSVTSLQEENKWANEVIIHESLSFDVLAVTMADRE